MITLVIGPMFSGKTSYLLAHERRFQIAKLKTLVIKWDKDTRYSTNQVISHDGNSSTGDVINVNQIDTVTLDIISKYDAFLIDEGQFFEGLHAWCDQVLSSNKNAHIVISALNGDYKQRPFQPMIPMYAIADSIIHVKSICMNCAKDAPFTIRTSNQLEQTLVGGQELYQPRCRACLYK
jgi:thymidine kinase